MKRKISSDSRQICWLYLFLGGFLAGTLLINMRRTFFMEEMDLLGAASLGRLKYLEINGGAFLLYVLKKRFRTIILLCVLATTYAGVLAISLFSIWLGMTAGFFLSAAAIRYGMKGILLILAGILPQYFVLVPAVIMLMNWCYQLCTWLYFPYRCCENTCRIKQQYYIKKILQILIIFGVVIIGSLLESYVNPIILCNFLNFF